MPALPYDDTNIFARILRGELPCHTIHEDGKTLAFLDVMPRTHGHTLVIPKAPSRNILDIDESDLMALIAGVKRIARAAKQAFHADGVTIQQFNETAGGQMIFHTHFHILPRWEGVALKPHSGKMADQSKLKADAELVRTAFNTLKAEGKFQPC